MDESLVTFDRPGEWTKRWSLLNSDILLAKRKQQGVII